MRQPPGEISVGVGQELRTRVSRIDPLPVSLDLFWLRDESLEDSANLPDPHLLAQEIADDLRSALGQTEDVLGDLEARTGKVRNGENG